MVYLEDMSCACRYTNLIRRKDDIILTKKDYHRAFIENPSFFFRKGKFRGHFRAYLKSPSRINLSKNVKLFLFLDKIVQMLRMLTRVMFTDMSILLLSLMIIAVVISEISILYKHGAVAIILAIGFLNILSHAFYLIDHILSIVHTIFVSSKNTSTFLAKSYLDLTKEKSYTFDFLYFDKKISENDRKCYEDWVKELMLKFPNLSNYYFNIFIADETSNILDESRKMLGIYDYPGCKIYDYEESLLGLYTSAGTTVITKNITKEYFLKALELYDDNQVGKKLLNYSNDILKLKKHCLYHEFSHMLTKDVCPALLTCLKCKQVYIEEKDLIFPSESSYFKYDIEEYMAESVAQYIEDESIGDLEMRVDFKDTQSYNIIESFIKYLSSFSVKEC